MDLVLFLLVKKIYQQFLFLEILHCIFHTEPLKQVYMTIYNGSRIVNRHFSNILTHIRYWKSQSIKNVTITKLYVYTRLAD